MDIGSHLDRIHTQIRQNRWLWYFSIFCRLTLALGFLPAGLVKIMGERFASGLSALHPMGHYLEALHHTDYYYTFIGIAQIIAAILLLIPRTVVLGALLYLPIIFNIWILTLATRFDGSLVTSPLMVLANLYVLAWNFDKIKWILPLKWSADSASPDPPKPIGKAFPFRFFLGVIATVALVLLFALFGYEVKPYNSFKDCTPQFSDGPYEAAGEAFCRCIHSDGRELNECLAEYEAAKQ